MFFLGDSSLSTLGQSINISKSLNSTAVQVISQWIGSANVLRNQKINEFKQNLKNKQKPNQSYAHIRKNEDFSFIKDVPVQILRNASSQIFQDLEASKKGIRQFPKIKNKFKKRNCVITSALFIVEDLGEKSRIVVFNHAKKNKSILFSLLVDIKKENINNQLILSRQGGDFSISFSYNDDIETTNNDVLLSDLSHLSREELKPLVLGVDRGVARPIYASNGLVLVYSLEEKEQIKSLNRKKARTQKYLAKMRRRNNSHSKNKTKYKNKIAKIDAKIANIKSNFSHHTSKKLVEATVKILSFEDLKLKNMTKKAKPKKEGRAFVKNNQSQKRGLNRAILNVNLGQIAVFTKYKLNREGKAWVDVNPANTSKIHHLCGSINTGRPKQAVLVCKDCNQTVDADLNASLNIASRGIDYIKEKTFNKKKSRKKISLNKKKQVVTESSLL